MLSTCTATIVGSETLCILVKESLSNLCNCKGRKYNTYVSPTVPNAILLIDSKKYVCISCVVQKYIIEIRIVVIIVSTLTHKFVHEQFKCHTPADIGISSLQNPHI